MPISSTDIKFRGSGGASETVPDNWLGGIISNTFVVDDTLHNVFDKVTGDEALAGKTNYRGIYVENDHGSLSLEDAVVWLQSNTTNNEISIAKADEGVGDGVATGVMETIGNEDTAPSGPTFTAPATKAAAVILGTMATQLVHGIWERRVIAPATSGENAASFQLKVEGDTQQ